MECVMPQELFAVVKPFIERIHDRLVDTARSDPLFRDQLGALGEYLSALVAGAAPIPPSPAEQPVVSGQESGVGGQADGSLTPDSCLPSPERSAEHVSAAGGPPGPSIHELAARLRFDGPPAPQPSPVRTFAESGTDLSTLAARCRLKAEAARWAAGGRDPMVV